jgi:hypothetical protein
MFIAIKRYGWIYRVGYLLPPPFLDTDCLLRPFVDETVFKPAGAARPRAANALCAAPVRSIQPLTMFLGKTKPTCSANIDILKQS